LPGLMRNRKAIRGKWITSIHSFRFKALLFIKQESALCDLQSSAFVILPLARSQGPDD